MVRLATLALFFLSATSVVLDARPTHKRRSVCKTSTTTTKVATATAGVEDVKTTKTSSGFKTVTKTTTSSKATSTADDSSDDSSNDGGDDGAISGSVSANALFPVAGVSQAWSVASNAISKAKTLPLTDKTFIVTKEAGTSERPVVTYQGQKAIHAHMKKGAYDLKTKGAGFSFYTPGATINGNKPLIDLTSANEMTFGYSIFFSKGYDFNLGGKLPGLYGGINDNVAATCSGGRHNPGCWSARLMFRPGGAGELYLYIPPGVNSNDNKCGKLAKSKCPDTGFGNSVGRSTWTWETGKWQTVVQRLKLNTPGKADGESEVFINGKSVLKVGGITWRTNEKAVARGIQMQIFHGGHSPEWAPDHDQDVYFADFSASVLN